MHLTPASADTKLSIAEVHRQPSRAALIQLLLWTYKILFYKDQTEVIPFWHHKSTEMACTRYEGRLVVRLTANADC